jgi:hypothetical protein
MIFYDELMFLDEAVCPKSMIKLDFVKLLSDKKILTIICEGSKCRKNTSKEGKTKHSPHIHG